MIRRDSALGLLLVLAIVAGVSFSPLPDGSQLNGALHDFAHVAVFAVLGVVLARLLRRLPGRHSRWPRVILATLLAGIAFGFLTEYLQSRFGGSLSFGDIARDLLGTVLGLFGARACEPRTAPNLRRGLLVAIVVGLLGSAIPLAQVMATYRSRDLQFPLLFDAAAPRSLAFIRGPRAPLQLVPVPPDLQGLPPVVTTSDPHAAPPAAIEVTLDQGAWPGITFEEPQPDWRGWQRLFIELANPDAAPVTLVLRINDRSHDNHYDDRFNTPLELPPRSSRRFEFALADIERLPNGRRLDLRRIDKLTVFHVGPAPGRRFLLYRAGLAHDPSPSSAVPPADDRTD